MLHVEVVAAVITDPRGRILLARRTAGRELAGLWEFPGGKVEPGESADAALVRELREELGIDADIGAPLIVVTQAGANRRLRLDFREVRAWRGRPRGHEGQALAWVPPDKLHRYPMPPADRPVVAALREPPLLLVTPPPAGSGEAADAAWLRALREALGAGISRVQLRLPGIAPARAQALATAALAACNDAGARAWLNAAMFSATDAAAHDDAVIAHASAFATAHGAGLHLPSSLLAACDARPVAADSPLSASCHDIPQLRQAEAIGCDLAIVGPLRATGSHPGVAGIGWGGFDALREHSALPLYAIGGLAAADIATARAHGAQGIAAITALWPTPPPPPPPPL